MALLEQVCLVDGAASGWEQSLPLQQQQFGKRVKVAVTNQLLNESKRSFWAVEWKDTHLRCPWSSRVRTVEFLRLCFNEINVPCTADSVTLRGCSAWLPFTASMAAAFSLWGKNFKKKNVPRCLLTRKSHSDLSMFNNLVLRFNLAGSLATTQPFTYSATVGYN